MPKNARNPVAECYSFLNAVSRARICHLSETRRPRRTDRCVTLDASLTVPAVERHLCEELLNVAVTLASCRVAAVGASLHWPSRLLSGCLGRARRISIARLPSTVHSGTSTRRWRSSKTPAFQIAATNTLRKLVVYAEATTAIPTTHRFAKQ